jgi:hypothetical protein
MIPIHLFSGRLGNQMFRHAYLYAQFRDGKIPDLYLQNYKYFDKYESEIKQLFGTGIGFLPEVGIHIRRGDYVGNSFYVDLCQTDYYERAIALFQDKKFLVISDDIEFAKDFISKRYDTSYFKFSENTDPVDDLNLLASCSSVIMANSSLSWWAAYLCPNPSKKIIYPKRWFTDNVDRVGCKPEWIAI